MQYNLFPNPKYNAVLIQCTSVLRLTLTVTLEAKADYCRGLAWQSA